MGQSDRWLDRPENRHVKERMEKAERNAFREPDPNETEDEKRDREFMERCSPEADMMAFSLMSSLIEEAKTVEEIWQHALDESSISQDNYTELVCRAAKRSQVRKKRSSSLLFLKLHRLYSEGLCTLHDRMNDTDRQTLVNLAALSGLKKPFWRSNEWFIKKVFMSVCLQNGVFSEESTIVAVFAPLILLVAGFDGKKAIGMWDGNGNWILEEVKSLDDCLVWINIQPRCLEKIEELLEWPNKRAPG